MSGSIIHRTSQSKIIQRVRPRIGPVLLHPRNNVPAIKDCITGMDSMVRRLSRLKIQGIRINNKMGTEARKNKAPLRIDVSDYNKICFFITVPLQPLPIVCFAVVIKRNSSISPTAQHHTG